MWLIVQDWDFDGDLDIVVDNQPGNGQSFVMINKGRSLFSTLEVVQLESGRIIPCLQGESVP